MKRMMFLPVLLLPLFMFSQIRTGNMKVQIIDRLTGQALSATNFTVTMNDTAIVVTSDAQGAAMIYDIRKGPYIVRFLCEGYLSFTFQNILIGEGKTAYIIAHMIPGRQLSRKEKKKMGIK